MTQRWTVRPVSIDDALTIARHRYYRGESSQDIETYANWVAKRIADGNYLGLLAESAGEVIAGAGCNLLEWGPTRGEHSALRARVVNVFTEEAWRRKGIARSLLQACMAACRSRGVGTFNLAASADGEGLYQALGFEHYGHEMILRSK